MVAQYPSYAHTGSGWVHAGHMEVPPVSIACVQSLVCDLGGRTGMVAGCMWVQAKAAVSSGGSEAWSLAAATSCSPLQRGPCNPFKMVCSPTWSCTQEVAEVIAAAICGSSSWPCRCQLQVHGVTQMYAASMWGPTGISYRHRVQAVCAWDMCSVLVHCAWVWGRVPMDLHLGFRLVRVV